VQDTPLPQHLQQHPAEQTALLNDRLASPQMRRSVAQHIANTHGNHYLSRLYDIQRDAEPMLKVGAKGDAVKNLQQSLLESGAQISADGIFGPKTRQAVVMFQRAAGLAADGIVGPQTWAKLHAGGISIVNANATTNANAANPSQQLVLAKLKEVKLLMKKLGSTSGGKNASQSPLQAPDIPHTHPSHDAEDGEDKSWWDKAKDTAGAAVDNVEQTANGAWGATKEAAGSAVQGAGEVWDKAKEGAGEVWNGAKEVAGTASGIVGGIVDNVKEKTGEIVQGVEQTVNKGIDTVVQGVSDVASDVGKSIEDFGEEVSAKFADEIASVKEFLSEVGHYLQHPEDALAKLEEILAGLRKKAGELAGGDDEPDSFSGTIEDIVAMGAMTACHDVNAPRSGQRTLRLNPTFNTGSETQQRVPQGGNLSHDSIVPTLSYDSDISSNDPVVAQVPASDFGTTGSRIKMDKLYFTMEHFTDYVNVSARLYQTISWAITDRPGRINVKADLENVDQSNWQQAADDLDPDKGKTQLGAPMRTKFWASDITAEHEQFHAADRDTYMREAITPTLLSDLKTREVNVDWLINRYSNLKADLKAILSELAVEATMLDKKHMGEAGEHRAYAGDEPKYRARAAAIRKKAADNGWK